MFFPAFVDIMTGLVTVRALRLNVAEAGVGARAGAGSVVRIRSLIIAGAVPPLVDSANHGRLHSASTDLLLCVRHIKECLRGLRPGDFWLKN